MHLVLTFFWTQPEMSELLSQRLRLQLHAHLPGASPTGPSKCAWKCKQDCATNISGADLFQIGSVCVCACMRAHVFKMLHVHMKDLSDPLLVNS